MLNYVLRRLLHALIAMFLLTLLAFAVIRVIPGDATLGLMSDSRLYTDAQLALIRSDWGLDKPVANQYLDWVLQAAHGDFGRSYYLDRPVAQDLADRLPVTGELAIMTVIFSTALGITLGTVAALRPNSWVDNAARSVAVLGLSIPEFWLATLVIVVPAVFIGWLPPLKYVPLTESVSSNLQLFLPAAVVASLQSAAVITRLVRTSLLEVLRADYVRTARAKGLPGRIVVTRHALRNALVPVFTVLGLQVAALLGGTVVIETIFNIPGIGRQTLLAIQFRDYPQLQMNILFFGAVVILTNLIVDFLYGVADPRVTQS